MTLAIAAATENYVLLAADRRISRRELAPPHRVLVQNDDTCKIVALCGLAAIAYTGPAQIAGLATHEWIATTLAAAECMQSWQAADTLTKCATDVFATVDPAIRATSFLMVGWDSFKHQEGLRPHVCQVSNMYDERGTRLPTPSLRFLMGAHDLRPGEQAFVTSVGEEVSDERTESLRRNIQRMEDHEIGPKDTLRLLVAEILRTSIVKTVGRKVLAVCLPRKSAQAFVDTGRTFLVAAQPSDDEATFAYFEEGYDDLRQFGPTFACGRKAFTDVVTENDASTGRQSSSMKILRL